MPRATGSGVPAPPETRRATSGSFPASESPSSMEVRGRYANWCSWAMTSRTFGTALRLRRAERPADRAAEAHRSVSPAQPLAYSTPPIAIFAGVGSVQQSDRAGILVLEWRAANPRNRGQYWVPRWTRGRTVRSTPAAWRGTQRDRFVTISRQVATLYPRQLAFPHTMQIARLRCGRRGLPELSLVA